MKMKLVLVNVIMHKISNMQVIFIQLRT